VLCFGPAGSFKTAGLVIPAVLEWTWPVITTSIKPDVLRATLQRRLAMGEVWVYDPLSLSGVPAAQWTPLAHCTTYTQARKVARTLAKAADVTGLREQDANYWTLLGAKLLGVLLYAAARSDRTMADVARWVDIQEQDEVTEALEDAGDAMALDAWSACRARPDNTLGSVYGTAETLLDVFADPTIAASADGCDLDVDALLEGANTLYLYAPANEQGRLRPLFELLVSTIITRAEELAAHQPNGMLSPRLLVCLDEAGNCAALAKLPELATTARGQGIQLLTSTSNLCSFGLCLSRVPRPELTVLQPRGRRWRPTGPAIRAGKHPGKCCSAPPGIPDGTCRRGGRYGCRPPGSSSWSASTAPVRRSRGRSGCSAGSLTLGSWRSRCAPGRTRPGGLGHCRGLSAASPTSTRQPPSPQKG
jgi:Type IV secretory system Conjugative DNA transfer